MIRDAVWHILLPAVLGLPLGAALSWASVHAPRLARRRREGAPQAVSEQGRRSGGSVDLRDPVAHKFGWQGVAAAIAASGLLVALQLRFEPFWSRPLVSVASIFFLLIAIVDVRHRLVLNAMVVPAALVALVAHVADSPDAALSALIGGAFGLAPFLATALVKPGGMGGGDVKLAGLVGLTLGFPQVLWALAVAILTGGVVSLLLLLSTERTPADHLPYAPFLCLGAFVALLHDPLTPILLSVAP